MHGDFLLDPEVAYLNHGSYGACTREVFEEYQRLQGELEREPTNFFVRRAFTSFWGPAEGPGAIDEARAALAGLVGAATDDLVLVPSATSGLNAVLRSLRIRPEEEILTTKHEYGAILRTLEFMRANVVACEPEDLIGSIGVRSRAILVSHVTSPTALVIPVEEICAAARKARVLTIVDGAHAPGQLSLDVEALGADVYAGNCHNCRWRLARSLATLRRDGPHRAGPSEGATMTRYTKEQLGECFPHKPEDWHSRTADDLNFVHAHVDELEAQGLSGEDAWLETIELMRAQREAARKS